MKAKMTVGQPIWYRSISNRHGADISLKETTVSKIGKKYFEVNDIGERFFIDTLEHDAGNYLASIAVYLSKVDYEEEVERKNIFDQLFRMFGNYSHPNIELSKLRRIIAIINE